VTPQDAPPSHTGTGLRKVGRSLVAAFLVFAGVALFSRWVLGWRPEGSQRAVVVVLSLLAWLVGLTGAILWLVGFFRDARAVRK
jgi:hypothetical protein